MTEREIKLALPGRFAIPPLLLDDRALTAMPRADLNLRATYYDTADLRLARSGVTLRYRTGETGGPVWTLKLPVGRNGSELERDELHFDGPRREPPERARLLVTAHARGAPLVAVATLRTKRRCVHLLCDETVIAELAHDEVSVVENRHVVSRFRELELEAIDRDVNLEPLASQLRLAGATDAEPIPKVVRALGSRATAPPDVAQRPLPSHPTMTDALVASIVAALARLVHHDPLARLGDIEGVHQARVALRRLRSDLRTLADVVEADWLADVEPRLRSLGASLGAARDLDVMVAGFRTRAAEDGPALSPLFEHLEERHAHARRAMRDALEDASYPALLDTLVDATRQPPVRAAGAEPAERALPPLVLAAWGRLAKRADRLRAGSAPEAFHRARIAAKRTRYAAELTASVLSATPATGARAMAAQLAGIQDLLGAMQDARVAEDTIVATLDQVPDPGDAFAAGRLAERCRADGEAARAAFLDRWPRVRRRRWRRWTS